MKKFYFIVGILAIAFAGFGCAKQNNVAGTIASIMPPPANVPGPIRVTMGTSPVNFSGTFVGPLTQTVTIQGKDIDGSEVNQKQFVSTAGLNWGPFTSKLSNGTPIVVTATIAAPGAYKTSPSVPPPPNTTGHDVTTFADSAMTNTSKINIDDQGPASPPPPAAETN